MAKNQILTAALCFFTVILIITFSIGLPIYFRPFYYMQIDSLNIVQRSGGYEKEAITKAYDEVLDYLTIPGKEFGTGVFAHSESGKSHFEDCKALFNLNAVLCLTSLAGVVLLNILKHRNVFKLCYPFRRHYTFISGAATLTLFAIVGAMAAINFDLAFTVFHKVFFYGKDNWFFDSIKDEIILVLPQEFFMNCAILIASSIILISVSLIIFGLNKKQTNNDC